MKLFLLFLIFLSTHSFANRLYEPLYLKKTATGLCFYTNNSNTKLRDDHIILATLGSSGLTPEYVKEFTLNNIKKAPITKQSCITLPIDNIKNSGPYTLTIETGRLYTAYFCLSKKNNVITLHNRGSNMTCHKRDYKNPFHPILEIKNLFSKIKNWLL